MAPSSLAIGHAVARRFQHLVGADAGMERIHLMHQQLMAPLRSVVQGAMLYTFGSSVVLGVQEPTSDVDFVLLEKSFIEDGKGLDSTTQQAHALQNHLLGKLAKPLRKAHPEWKVEEIKRTRVPLLRVRDKSSFDITVNRRNGVRNSALMRRYFLQQPSARWLSLAIKDWSKRTGMNGPAGFLTSYGFNIMVVFYLLRRGQLQFVAKDDIGIEQADPVPQGIPLVAPDVAALGDQIGDFLHFYLDEFAFQEDVVTLSRAERTSCAQLGWTREAEDMKMADKVSYRLCIEDPYEVNLNVGRHVTAFKLDILKKHLALGASTGLGLDSPPAGK